MLPGSGSHRQLMTGGLMSEPISRRTALGVTAAAAGVALTGGGLTATARAASASAVNPSKTARVGATVTPVAYPRGTTWGQAMANFNGDVGNDFRAAKRFFAGPDTWPTVDNIGAEIQSLIDMRSRGLLCFRPALDGGDVDALVSSLRAIKTAGLTDVKITLYHEQGIDENLTAAQFKHVYAEYQKVREVFPLFVEFSGHAYETWAEYRPTEVDGIAVDFYANAWVHGSRLTELANWANEAGQELGIWEIGNSAYHVWPTAAEVSQYFRYITAVQSKRLKDGHLVGDMCWFNGAVPGRYRNTISGKKLTPLHPLDRTLLNRLFKTFNGVT